MQCQHKKKNEMKENIREMFYHGYNNYLKFAFPHDELKPLSGTYTDSLVEMGNAKLEKGKVYNGVALTLIDSLSSLAVLGNKTEFQRATKWIIDNVSFDIDARVNVFECTIRLLGGLLSAHVLAIDPKLKLIPPNQYHDGLLDLAADLGNRLLPVFQSDLPSAWVNLKHGVEPGETPNQCTAGVGTLILEFGLLSHYTGNNIFWECADRSLTHLWGLQSTIGLFGNTFNRKTRKWINNNAGIGAGIDSFYEYLFKSYLMFGNTKFLTMFQRTYKSVQKYLKNGDWYVEAHMDTGSQTHLHFNSLQAFWPGLQVMFGDLLEAIPTQANFLSIWNRYGALPERFLLKSKSMHSSENYYPLRPEIIESTYYLWRATRNPYYLRAAKSIYTSLNNITRVEKGFASIRNVGTKKLEDRMTSFFLSETCKYLYLIFDDNNFAHSSNYLFTTEGHLFPLKREIHDTFGDNSSYNTLLTPHIRENVTALQNEIKYRDKAINESYLMQCSNPKFLYIGGKKKKTVANDLFAKEIRKYKFAEPAISLFQHWNAENIADAKEKSAVHHDFNLVCFDPARQIKRGDFTVDVGEGSFSVSHISGEILDIRNLGSGVVEVVNRIVPRDIVKALIFHKVYGLLEYIVQVKSKSVHENIAAIGAFFGVLPGEKKTNISDLNIKKKTEQDKKTEKITIPTNSDNNLCQVEHGNKIKMKEKNHWSCTSGELVLGDPVLACTAQNKPNKIKGKIVFIERGECTFIQKVRYLEEAGAKGMILANIVEDANIILMGTDGSGYLAKIPSVMISRSMGLRLRNQIKKSTIEKNTQKNELVNLSINVTLAVKQSSSSSSSSSFSSSSSSSSSSLLSMPLVISEEDEEVSPRFTMGSTLEKFQIVTIGGWTLKIEKQGQQSWSMSIHDPK